MKHNTLNKQLIFVDFNGVLSYNDFWESIKSDSHPLHSYHENIEEYLFKIEPDIVKQWMLGGYTSEQVHRILEDKIGVPYDELWKVFVEDCSNIDISINIIKKLKQLKQDFYLILSTGNMDCFDRFTVKNNPILGETFNEIENSYNIKLLKSSNGGEYFRNKAEDLGKNMDNCFVLDDSEKICRIFTELGGKSFCVYGEESVLSALDVLTKYNSYEKS